MGAQPTLVAKGFFPDSCTNGIRNGDDFKLCAATDGPIIIMRQIDICITFGELSAKSTFTVAKTLLVSILIVAHFIEKYVIGIYPAERKLTRLDLKMVSILSTRALGKWPLTPQ